MSKKTIQHAPTPKTALNPKTNTSQPNIPADKMDHLHDHFTPCPPTFLRAIASLFYEALLLAALLMTAGLIFQVFFHFFGQSSALEWAYRGYLLVILFFYFGWCWTRTGQTLPMKSWWLRIEYADGRALTWAGATMRFAVATVLIVLIPAIAFEVLHQFFAFKTAAWAAASLSALPFAWRILDADSQFLHDRFSHTRLVWLGKKPKKPAQ